MNISWFGYAICSTIAFGIMAALIKIPSHKQQSGYAVTFWMFTSGATITTIIFWKELNKISALSILLGSAWSITYYVVISAQMRILTKIEAGTLYPILGTGSAATTILTGIVIFRERISLTQTIGIILSIVIIFLFSYQEKLHLNSFKLITNLIALILLSTLLKMIHKTAADKVAIQPYLLCNYLTAIPLAFIMGWRHHKDLWLQQLTVATFKSGLSVLIFGFIGAFFFLRALQHGKLATVQGIHALYILVTSIVAFILYKEKMTPKKVLLTIAAVGVVALIKIA